MFISLRAVISVIILLLLTTGVEALDYPHAGVNSIACDSCHYVYADEPSHLPPWTNHTPQDIDDTQFNTLCWSCHNDIAAPYMRTHSSLNIDNSYGNWTVECRVCHNPHYQKQLSTHGSASYIYSGISTDIQINQPQAGQSQLTMTGASWTVDEYQGMVLIPNVSGSRKKFGYKILSNTSDTLTVKKVIDLRYVTPGTDTFAIIYGNLINSTIKIDRITNPSVTKTGDKTVKFFKNTGTNSFSDGDGTYNGVCEVCHTLTTHFRNDGSGSDQLHSNAGNPAGTDCTVCHNHMNGFAHGSGGGTGCDECHGHDPGYGGATGGKGSYQTHSTHTENDADDLRGPNVGCSTCHNTGNFPNFADGVSYAAYKAGTPTTVCNGCHSPSGTYNGVSDAVIGAQNNWATGVYETDGSLKIGKEKWCAGCHDEVPSVVGGISAPNVIGDEDGAYTYGTGWGFYKTGHGVPAGNAYPYKGGLIEPSLVGGAAKPVECDSCHDLTAAHVDNNARTFNDGGSGNTDPSVYRKGYRLDQVPLGQGSGTSTREPMLVPWPSNAPNVVNNYRLCTNCHDSGPFLDSSNTNTNLETVGVNRHEYHLVFNSIQYPADWSGGNTSLITCVVCHNVHGSTRLAMVRDGKLTGREPGLRIWYKNDLITTNIGKPLPPSPEDLPLAASDGTAWLSNTVHNLCVGCHNSGILEGKDRTPFQSLSQPPTLDWTSETGYQGDGVNPDSASSGSTFTFRVKYKDTNNDAPGVMEVWVDVDGSNAYEADEKYAMSSVDTGDVNYTNGKIYTRDLTINSAGDNFMKYRFYATDGSNAAIGDPTADGSVTILNNAPALSWTGDTYFTADAVNPDIGGSGVNFEFRVEYTDADDQSPSFIQVWVDRNDDGDYLDASEKENMTLAGGGDGDNANGENYTKTLTLTYAGDGTLTYRFYASDGADVATGTPVSDGALTVLSGANSPPILEWEPMTCRAEGVKPASGIAGGSFEFLVNYTDPDNDCPPGAGDIQVWVDLDDSSSYEPGEKYNLSADDGGDVTCSDGKLYKKSMSIALAGDNDLNYRFYASDGTDIALGTPITDTTVTVVDALGVRIGSGDSGPLWYNSIQAAIDAARSGTKKVLVYEGAYNESLSLWQSNYSNSELSSVCGADVTSISSQYDIIFLQNVSGIVIDGFQITGGTRGINSNGGSATVSNCKIHNNNNSGSRGGGLNAGNASSIFTVVDSEIYSNSATDGGAAAFNAGFGHSFTRTIIRNNTVSGNAGAVFSQNGDVDFIDSIIKDNTANFGGGAVYSNGSDINFIRSTITGNTAITANSGVIDMPNGGDDTLFENCFVANNQGVQGGVAFVNTGAALTAVNSTFTSNQATGGNGGLFYNQNSTTTIRNSIIWNNTASGSGHIAYFNGGSMTVTDSIISNDGDAIFTNAPYFGGNSTPAISGYTSDNDPLFVNASGGDYHITVISDAVDNASATYAPADDIDKNARPQGSADDIGADEYQFTINAPALIWTGEINYVSDGVNPGSAAGGSSFTFRVDYIDADDNAPTLIEVWVDEDDNGAYSSNEKYSMTGTDSGDITFTDGKRYSKTLALAVAGDGSLNYRFYGSDGTFEATGNPTSGSIVTVTNNVPSLAWTGETNYTADGVHPDSAVGGTSFEFRIDYTDADNTAPTSIQMWIDINDNGAYEAGEKYNMTGTVGGDATYTDGKRYMKSLNLRYAGDGSLNYRFYASDGTDFATGTPASNKTVTLTNNTPTLSWTGETNYTTDGVNPDSGPDAGSFEFRIDYTDADNTAPSSVQVWVDENDNNSYEAGEKYTMAATDGGDTTYTNGKLYAINLTLVYINDGIYKYRFYASDDTNDAAGTPASDSTVTVTFTPNNAPTLDWTGETNYTTDGVDPQSSYDGDTFTFRVKYTDADDEIPSFIQVWIDENDNTTYEAGEKYAMTAVDAGDTTYNDGKLYAVDRALSFAGDGLLNYRFFANDGQTDAIGTPVSTGGTVTIIDPITVCSTGADFTTIQGAISDAGTTSGDFVRVCNGTYSENITYSGKNITIYSENGAASTTIEGSGADSPVVTFSNSETSGAVLKGFTINNQNIGGASARGIAISGTAAPVLSNLIVKGNNPASYSNGSAIYLDAGGVTINSSTIGGDSGDKNNSRYGSAIYAVNGGTAINVNGSTLSYNAADTQGGAIYLSSRTFATTIANSSVTYNTSVQNGGGILVLSSPLVIVNSVIDYNQSTQPIEGGGIALSGSSTTLTITGTSSVSNNSARNGGGIHADGIGNISITDTSIDSNSATSAGAGVAFLSMAGNVSLINSSVSNNTGGGSSAGIRYTTSTTRSLTITNTNIDSNTVTNTTNYDCGGLCIYPSDVGGANVTVNITGGSISGNTARNAGGLDAYSGSSSSINLTITGTVVSSNTATGAGGGLYFTGSNTTANVVKSWMKGNEAGTYGGGIYNQGDMTITNSFITGNLAEGVSYNDGGGIYTGSTSSIYNCTIAGNRTGRSGGGYSGGGTITNSILWANVAGVSNHQINNSPMVSYSDVGGTFAGTGNIDSDPFFVDFQAATAGSVSVAGDFHLCNGVDDPVAGCTGTSAAVDVASSSIVEADDYDGNPRPQGAGFDMGADELIQSSGSNNVPALFWAGETNFISDGVNPDSGAGGSNFEFRVEYIDLDGDAAGSIQIWIDENDNGTYEGFEIFDMDEVDAGDTDYSDGKKYTKTRLISLSGDGALKYRFYATDGTADAIGAPAVDRTVTIY